MGEHPDIGKRLLSRAAFFAAPELHAWLQQHPDSTRSLIRRWYVKSNPDSMIGQVESRLGPQYVGLLLEPGLAARLSEFLSYAEGYLQQSPYAEPAALRDAFSKHLGTTTLYRGLVLTGDEAATVGSRGLKPPGMLDPAVAEETLNSYFDPYMRARQSGSSDFSDALATSPVSDVSLRRAFGACASSLSMSSSVYEPVAESIGFWSSPRVLEALDSTKTRVDPAARSGLYVVQMDVPVISTVTDAELFSTDLQLGGETEVRFGDDLVIPERAPGLEVFVTEPVPAAALKIDGPLAEAPPRWTRISLGDFKRD
jgi:hypothetical protein